MDRRQACRLAGQSSMFVVNLIKRYKKSGLSHDKAHLMALYELRNKRLSEGRNATYVNSRIDVLRSRLDCNN